MKLQVIHLNSFVLQEIKGGRAFVMHVSHEVTSNILMKYSNLPHCQIGEANERCRFSELHNEEPDALLPSTEIHRKCSSRHGFHWASPSIRIHLVCRSTRPAQHHNERLKVTHSSYEGGKGDEEDKGYSYHGPLHLLLFRSHCSRSTNMRVRRKWPQTSDY